jgi:hypothetical protein
MEYLGEHEFGFAMDGLAFPSLSACRGIVYETSIGFFGFHNYGGNGTTQWGDRGDEFAAFVTGHTNGLSKGVRLYITGFTRQPQTGYVSPADMKGEAKAFAKALKFKGSVLGYDLSKSLPPGSAYAEFRRAAKKCVLSVKPWDDHNPDNARPKAGARADQPDHKMRSIAKGTAPCVRIDVDRTGLIAVKPSKF